MRILQLHCDSIEYTPVKREIRDAEEADTGTVRLEEVMVAFVAVEAGDDPDVARDAASQISESLGKVGCSRLLLYPYAHLSSDLAAPRAARDVLEGMRAALGGIEVHSSPFGWTKSYKIQVKGHPLAEGFRVIIAGEKPAAPAAPAVRSRWMVMSPDGAMIDAAKYDYTGHKKLEALARYETSGQRGADAPPPHVALMKKLGIADYEPASDPGNMRFFPNGRLIKSLIEAHVTERVRRYGGCEVETPIMYDSGHPSMASYFGRFPARQYSIDSEGRRLFLRFAACFGQFLMANQFQLSHKSLPYRLYELTRYSFRREQSGELVGLRRLRAFTMPDCHAFCKDMGQAVEEMGERFELSRGVLEDLGISGPDYEMAVRLTEEFYRENKAAVEGLVRRHGRPVLVEMWEERFFYFVLKWEFNYVDLHGKASALSTDQIDVENAQRYGIEYVDEDNRPRHPVILHNSPSGAVERVIYTLLEKAADESRRGIKPGFPLWLAPTQVRLVPLKAEFYGICDKIARTISSGGIRVDVDDRNESIGKRIREAEKEWIRYIAVVGPKEAGTGTLSVRDRESGGVREMRPEYLAAEISKQTEGRPQAPLNMPRDLSKRPQLMV